MAERLVMIGRGLGAAVMGVFLAGCPQRADEPAPPAEPTEQPAPDPAPVPTPTTLSRADLMGAARQAASAYALGQTPQPSTSLVGRTFSIAIPVGCGGPAASLPQDASDGLARVAWGPERRTIQFSLSPGDWTESPLITGAGGEWESVEGVWLPRPWLDAETCPTVRADPLQSGQIPSTPQTVGLAVVHTADDSRVDRRNGRAWAFTLRGEGEAAPSVPAQGWRVRFEGRVTGFPDGRAFRCRAAGPDTLPVCVAAVQLDRVALEGVDGAVLSEWRIG